MRRLCALLLLALSCSSPPSPCEGVTCGNGRCVLDEGKAACLCDVGFTAEGLSCRPLDPCASNPCMGANTECRVAGVRAICGCKPGHVEVSGSCVLAGPCTPNPCTAPNQTTCVVLGTSRRCDCNEGYAPEDGGCSAERFWDCSKQHTGDDDFEPDECPMLAKRIALGPPGQIHFLVPAGDEDWLRVATAAGHVLTITVSSGTVPVILDVVRPDGVTPVATDRRGVPSPTLTFLSPASGDLLVRVKAARSTDIGQYTVRIDDVGIDDYPNELDQATSVQPGAAFNGSLQYPGDVDTVALEVLTGRSYRVAFSGTATAASIVVDIVGVDGTPQLATLLPMPPSRSTVTLHPVVDGRYKLRAQSTSGTVGAFTLTTADLGPDDHGDIDREATPLFFGTSPQPASFERSSDVDVFSFPVTAGQLYAFRCNFGGSIPTRCRVILRDHAGVVVGDSYLTGFSEAGARATVSGTWTATLSMHGTSLPMSAPYSWQFIELGADDFGDDRSSAHPLTFATPVTGEIQAGFERDWFSFTAVAMHAYRVTVDCMNGCNAAIHDPSGAQLNTAGQYSPYSFRVTVGGTYYVSIGACCSGPTYTVRVEDLGLDDHPDTAANATMLTLGAATNGDIQFVGDHDVFAFMVTTPHLYEARCTALSGGVCELLVLNASGSNVGSASSGTSTLASFKALASGRYTVRVSGNASVGTGAYVLTVTDVGVDDVGDTPGQAMPITVGAPLASASIQFRYDADVFSFPTVATHVFRFVCVPSGNYGCQLIARDQNGVQVGMTYAGSAANSLSFLATSAGPYTVEVNGGNSGLATGTFDYRVLDDGPDDHGETAATGTPVSLGVPVTGHIQLPADNDVFTFAATAGQLLRFTCTSTSNTCHISVHNPSGALVDSGSVSGMITRASFRAAVTGTYSFAVTGSPHGSYVPYSVTMSEIVDDHGDGFSTATAMTVGVTTVGALDYTGDVDWFAVDLNPSTTYTVSRTGYSVLMRLFDSSGSTQLGVNASQITFTTSATARRYYVRVESFGGLGSYDLVIQ